jgi:hypothetical protein
VADAAIGITQWQQVLLFFVMYSSSSLYRVGPLGKLVQWLHSSFSNSELANSSFFFYSGNVRQPIGVRSPIWYENRRPCGQHGTV